MRPIDADVLLEKAWDADTRIGYVQVVDVGDILDAPTVELEQKGGKEMDDLISRQAAIEAIERNAYRHTYLDQIINIISNLPSAERKRGDACRKIDALPSARPFNKGLWVKQELAPQTLLFCSLCGCKKPQGVAGNFCPNCGADMRREDDGRHDKQTGGD